MIGADLEIGDGGQEPNLARAALHAWSARRTGVQGKDTVLVVTRDDYSLAAKGCAPKL